MRASKVNWSNFYAHYQASGLSISSFHRELVMRYGKSNVPSRSNFFRCISAIKNSLEDTDTYQTPQHSESPLEQVSVVDILPKDLQHLEQTLKYPGPKIDGLMQQATVRIYCPGDIIIEAPVLSVESLILTLIRRSK